jgi:hypothetical protein
VNEPTHFDLVTIAGGFAATQLRFAPDPLLEGAGFEPSVPGRERNESRSETGTVTEARKVRPEAVAYLPGTGGSNPVPSSGQSVSRGIFPSYVENPAFPAGVRGGAGSAVGRDGRGAVI